MNQRGIELSFGWIFSIVIGGALLVLALYAASQLVNEERRVQQSFTAQELLTRLTGLTTSLETASRPGALSFSTPTRITLACTRDSAFGTQEVRVASRSGMGAPWNDNGIPARSPTLYVFAAKPSEGTTFSMLVRPLHLPFKIGDTITLWSGSYCFVQPPTQVEEELALLEGAGNPVRIARTPQECARNSTIVCFSAAQGAGAFSKECAVKVDLMAQQVEKQGRRVAYIESLLMAAIVSEPELYECNVQRLLLRAAALTLLYRDMSVLIAARSQNGCSSAMQEGLVRYQESALNTTSRSLASLETQAKALAKQNPSACPLWKEDAA